MRSRTTALILAAFVVGALVACDASREVGSRDDASPGDPVVVAELNAELRSVLVERSFTGRIEETLETRLGRPLDARLADVGRLLFFDPILSLTRDNSCAGCHGPNVSFNDSGSIAIGVGNNGVVGPGRKGPFNQRRAPTLINAAFYPRLMWDSRFFSVAHDPFRNDLGFVFPEPEGEGLSHLPHLLTAQAFTPVVNRVEMAGSYAGDNGSMRSEIADRVGAVEEYRSRFAEIFDDVAAGEPIRYQHIARALAEFQFTLVRADAPFDRFARGDDDAMTPPQKEGALLFFGRGFCGECHIVRDFGNEMFSDFEPHVLGVPQLVPTETNVVFDGPGQDEDYGLEQVSGRPFDRYKFRTSPIRNAVFQPTFMHNGAYVCLEDAVRHHFEAPERLERYVPEGLDPALGLSAAPTDSLYFRLHGFMRDQPMTVTEEQVEKILDFIRVGLTDPGASPDSLRHLVPESLPSGLSVHEFEWDVPLGGGC